MSEAQTVSKKCLCKYFPEPCSSCVEFNFGGAEKDCEECVFNKDRPYPPLTFEDEPEWIPINSNMVLEPIPSEFIVKNEKLRLYDEFKEEVSQKHLELHIKMKNALLTNDSVTVTECLNLGLNVNNSWSFIHAEDGWRTDWTYLHAATSEKQHEIMNILIENGAVVDATGEADWGEELTPLFWTFIVQPYSVNDAPAMHVDFVGAKILISAGADPLCCDDEGTTAQQVCMNVIGRYKNALKQENMMKEIFAILHLFLMNGGDLSTVMDLAEDGACMLSMYMVFILAGADPYMLSKEGKTILYYLQNNPCQCQGMLDSIDLFQKATKLKLKNTSVIIEDANTQCSICCSSDDETNFCKLKCCNQNIHVKCLERWLRSDSNHANSCPFCRETVRCVDMITIKTTWTPSNVSKKINRSALICDYLF